MNFAALRRVVAAAGLGLLASWVFTTANPAQATASCSDIGTTWTPQTSAADSLWYSVTWGGPAGQEKFVAVSGPFPSRVMTSPDGITWTPQTPALTNTAWQSVTWGGPAGQELFVAVANSGGNRVMTSPDGITWTSRTSADDTKNWFSVTWGGPAGQEKFVATANSGSGNRVMTSPDGITWTSQASAADNNWLSVTWGGPAGQEKFVAVANSGTGNRVMTSSCPTSSTAAAPTISSVTAGDGSLAVAFSPGSDGGSSITNYKYSVDGTTYTALNPATTTSPFTISGLTNGTSYSVTIKAVNANGDSPASNAITGTPVAPAATPTEPNNTPTPTSVAATLTVAPTPGLVETVSLPETGGNSSTAAMIGLFLAIAGLILVSRRKIIR